MAQSPNKKRPQTTIRGAGAGEPFASILRDFLQNPNLSHEAIGLGAQMLSRPPDWEHTASWIAQNSKSGIKRVWRMLGELEEHGYVASYQARSKAGTWDRRIYVVSDDPASLQQAIENIAQEIAEMQGDEPHRQNGSAAPHRHLRSTAGGTQQNREHKKTDKPQQQPTFEVRAAFEAYNSAAKEIGFPRAQKLNAQRQQRLQQRLDDYRGLEGWQDALDALAASYFVRSQKFRPDLDWLIDPAKDAQFERLLAGQYAAEQGRSGGNGLDEIEGEVERLAQSPSGKRRIYEVGEKTAREEFLKAALRNEAKQRGANDARH